MNKKLKHHRTFIGFIVNLISYLKALLKFELTMNQFCYTTGMHDFQLAENKKEIEFYLTVA